MVKVLKSKGNMVEKARAFALAAHTAAKNVRKYTGEPYINHPAHVAAIIRPVATPEMLAAAWLHDVVEDANIPIEVIADEFGPVVATMVWHLSKSANHSDGKRAVRRSIELMHMGTLTPDEATVKVGDITSNLSSIVKLAKPKFARMYLKEKTIEVELLASLGAAPHLVVNANNIILDSWIALAERNA